MRDKLIRILKSVSEPYEGADPDVGVDAILSELRCDKCKYWQGGYSRSFCERLSNQSEWDGMNQELFEIAGGDNQTYIWTAPSYFCALFETK